MPDLSTLYPQVQPLGGYAAGLMQGQQYNDAQQNQQINQQGALADLWMKQQKNPLLLENQRLANEGLVQSNRSATTKADKEQYDFDWEKRFEDQRYQKTLDEYANAHSAAELAATETRVKQAMLTAKTPQERAQAERMFAMLSDVRKKALEIQQQGDQQARVANIHEAGQDRRAKEANAVKQAAAGRRPPRTLQEQYTYLLEDVRNAKTPEEQAQLQQQADAVFDAMIKARAAGAPAMMAGPNGTFVPNPNYGAQPTAPTMPTGKQQWTPPAGWK